MVVRYGKGCITVLKYCGSFIINSEPPTLLKENELIKGPDEVKENLVS